MKEYNAILVDTSIYDNFGLKLDQGYFASLKQFKKTPIEFLIPDVIKREVLSHLEEKIRLTQNSMEKSLKDSIVHQCLNADACEAISGLLKEKQSANTIACNLFSTYSKNIGAFSFECDDFVTISEVLEQYFSKLPPFGKGKKKSEFPDAIILMAAEAWAIKNDKKILAIAKDGDWEQFCKLSKYIDHTEELPRVFQLLEQNNAQYPYFKALTEALESETADDFLDQVEGHLSSELYGVAPIQVADSFQYWEADGCNGELSAFSLVSNEINIIDIEPGYAIFELSASIEIEVEGEFSLYAYDTIDGDHVYVGGVSATADDTFESKLLISVEGDLNAGLADLWVTNVEIVEPISSIDFGYLEPDYSE